MSSDDGPGGGGSFTTIRRVNRTEQVRAQLVQAIDRGDFKPGDALPSERALCELFDVSRVSVREAIRGLEAVGMVTVQHGRGSFVAERHGDGYAEPFARWLDHHRQEVIELLKVRGALEELAAEEAARLADPDLLAEVRTAHQAFRDAVADPGTTQERLVELDLQVHETVSRASGSRLLTDLIRELNTYLAESRRVTLAPDGRPQVSADQHAAIVDAVLAGQPEQAKRAARDHVHWVRETVAAFEVASPAGA